MKGWTTVWNSSHHLVPTYISFLRRLHWYQPALFQILMHEKNFRACYDILNICCKFHCWSSITWFSPSFHSFQSTPFCSIPFHEVDPTFILQLLSTMSHGYVCLCNIYPPHALLFMVPFVTWWSYSEVPHRTVCCRIQLVSSSQHLQSHNTYTFSLPPVLPPSSRVFSPLGLQYLSHM